MRALGFKISKESIENMIGKQVCYLSVDHLKGLKLSLNVSCLLTQFKLGTVSYRPGFSTQIYCPSEKHVSSKSYIPERSLPEIILSVEVTCLIDNNCYNHFFFCFYFKQLTWILTNLGKFSSPWLSLQSSPFCLLFSQGRKTWVELRQGEG